MNQLKILKVKDFDEGPKKPLPENLPQPPTCVLMVSPVKTGKSTIISNLLLNPAFYGPEYFDDCCTSQWLLRRERTGPRLLGYHRGPLH